MTRVLNLFSCMFVSTTTPFSCSYFSLRLLLPSFTDTLHLAIHAFLSYHHYFITLDHQLFPMINAAGLLVVLWHMTLVVFWSLQYCWNPTSSYLVHSFLWLCYFNLLFSRFNSFIWHHLAMTFLMQPIFKNYWDFKGKWIWYCQLMILSKIAPVTVVDPLNLCWVTFLGMSGTFHIHVTVSLDLFSSLYAFQAIDCFSPHVHVAYN